MDGKNPSRELSVMKDYRGILEETVSDDTKAIFVMYHLSYATVPEYVNNFGTLLKKHWDSADSLKLLMEVAQDVFKVMNKIVVFENKNNFFPKGWDDFKMATRSKKKSSNDGQDGTPIRSAMSAKKRMDSGSESPEEFITQELLTKICKMADSPEICVDALWFKEPDCN